ncbi:PaaI family thioesterase [Kitasatospora sp. NPDC048194]|uniref:PaaI family thioesterase n=1 Tax=Kitasatospora sp. NPDC048194 TaxID=3364045 RepID=UPI0037121F49
MTRQEIGAERSTILSWRESGLLFADDPQQSGLQYLRGLASGEVLPPPVAQVLGIAVETAEPGRVRFTMPVPGFLANHLGVLAGGILSTVIDAALGCAVLSAVTAEQDIVTLDLGVDFLRPVPAPGGPVTVDAEVVHLGRNRGLATCRALDEDLRLCAVARSTCLIRRKSRPAPADSPLPEEPGSGTNR